MTARVARLAVLAALVVATAGAPDRASAASPGQASADEGAALFRGGQFRAARDAFREAVRRDPGLVKAWDGLGWSEYRLGHLDEALRIWRDLLKIDAGRPETLDAIARVERERSRDDGAPPAAQRSDSSPAISASPAPPPPPPPEPRARRPGPVEQGDEAYRSGDWPAAEGAYRAALGARPGDPRVLGKLGWAVRKAGRLDEAIAIWRDARARPGCPPQVDRYLADAYLEQKDPGAARAAYARAVETTPRDDPAALLDLADIGLAVDDPDGAEQALETLFARPDLDGSWAVRAANLFVRRHAAGRGVAFLERLAAAQAVPRRALVLVLTQAGEDAVRAWRLDEAVDALTRALTLDGQNRTALQNLGLAYRRLGRLDETEETWRRYARAFPGLLEPHNLLANLYLDKQEHEKALEEARAGLALEPGHRGALAVVVRALFGMSRVREGRRVAEDLADRYPDDANAQRLLAQALTTSREFGAAARQWARVIELDPTPVAQQNWVRAVYEAGDADAAVQAAARLVASGQATTGVVELLAEDALARNAAAAAAAWYRELARRDPDRLVYWRNLLMLLDRLGRFDEQVRVARDAVRHLPDRSELQLDLANALGNAGALDEAIGRTRSFLAAHPDNRAAFESLVGLLDRAGRAADARSVLAGNSPSFFKDYERRMIDARLVSRTRGIPAAMEVLRPVAEPAPGVRFVPILLYHGVVDHRRTLQISTEAFESQMAALAQAGYQAITLTELARMVDGELTFPRRPILITFDDARADSFAFGDPILKRYGLKATMFVPTGRLAAEDAFHAGWGTLVRHARSGRWDIQAHGHDAHNPVKIDAAGHTGEFLAYKAWLPAERRTETSSEYLDRLSRDDETCKTELEERIPGHRVLGYAYPLNQVAQAQPSADDRTTHLNETVTARYFRFGLIQDEDGYNELEPGARAPFMLRRFEVPGDWDGQALLAHLARREPSRVARLQLARLTAEDGGAEAARDMVEAIAREEPLVTPDTERLLAEIAAGEGRPREAAAHLAASPAPAPLPGEARDALPTRLAWKNDPRVGGRARFAGDSDRRSVLAVGSTAHASFAPQLDLELGVGEFRVTEPGARAIAGPQLDLGAAAAVGRRLDVSAWGRYRGLTDARQTLNGGVALRLRQERHALRLHWTYEDVETVPAELRGIRDHDVGAGWEYESPGWHVDANVARVLYGDGNWRNDVHASALHLFGTEFRLGLGASADYQDSRFAPRDYYAPLRLGQAMARASLSYGWRDSSTLGLEAGLGVAHDAVHGGRRSGLARLRFSRWWGASARWGTTIAVEGKTLPGYQSVGALFLLEGRL
jgi:tetratricopeptide (TPR) repeat protein